MADDSDPSPPPEAPPQGPPGANAVEPDIVNVDGGDGDPASSGGSDGAPTGPEDYDPDVWDDYWKPLFPYERPYEQQEAMIQEVIRAGAEDGFVAAEGPCGTGKTLAAVMGALALIRHPDTKYERVLCLTSVNQQLRAFEEDLKRINRNRDEGAGHAVRGLTLIGKDSVCSYSDTGDIQDDAIYSRCESLRDPVKDKLAGKSADQKVKLLKSLTSRARADAGVATEAGRVTQQLAAVDGDTTKWEAPYQKAWPTLKTGDEGEPRDFCAFYAKSRLEAIEEEENGGGSITFARAETPGVLTPPDVRNIASEEGLCPHMAMMSTVENAEVIVGNYYHAFDPQTVRTFTGSLMDDSTLLVCDEAHDLVPSVRGLLSDSVSLETLEDAAGQLRSPLLQVGDPEDENRTDATFALENALREQGADMDDVRALMELFEGTQEWLESQVAEMLDAHTETDGWADYRDHETLPERVQVPMQAPGAAGDYSERDIPLKGAKWNGDLPFQADYYSQWASDAGQEAMAEAAAAVGEAAMETLAEVSDDYPEQMIYDDDHPEASAARKLARWVREDYTDYYRTVTLERREKPRYGADYEWEKHYTVHLELHNCIPSDEIAERLSRFGGGVLMSATLAPLDTFREEIGLDRIAEGIDLSDTASPVDQVPPRPIYEAVYSLRFPEENRLSRAAETPKFTYKNRGGYNPENPPGTSYRDLTVGFNETRTQHASVIETVAATTPGNVLVGMPSYAEGDWAKRVLDASDKVSKPVLLDRSSSDEWTEELKRRFFAGDPKVLVTSLRGTLTTGVDYDGDRLKAAVICGVPFPLTQGAVPTARQNAYDERYNSGFEVAFTVPAVRRARQALGRVIRSTDDVGVRVLCDKRYAGTQWEDVREHIPEPERSEYRPTSREGVSLEKGLRQFWRSHNGH
jgi:DNA excision repair protein ERCC-2